MSILPIKIIQGDENGRRGGRDKCSTHKRVNLNEVAQGKPLRYITSLGYQAGKKVLKGKVLEGMEGTGRKQTVSKKRGGPMAPKETAVIRRRSQLEGGIGKNEGQDDLNFVKE